MQHAYLSFERLIREHRAIAELATVLRATIADDAAPDVMCAALEALSDQLVSHLATEDADIYPQLMLSADEGAAAAAREAIAAFETLAADWRDYAAHWTSGAIEADCEGFAEATAAILDRLDARVRSENELLYPMALRAAHIRLRDAA
ncbi:hemerythrin domain-containing protein [Sphingomonas baiyangensis]|nr:hemerythrin domain-containing protein [Sphingomonas baiyangensis]